MDDLISRESLLKKAEYHAAPFEDVLCVTYDDVLNSPSVDAAEVVRCKHCKYWDKHNNLINECQVFKTRTANHFYCGSGREK